LSDPLAVEQHYIIKGEKLEKVVTVFAKQLIKDMYELVHHHDGSAPVWTAGLSITIPSYKKSIDRDIEKCWTLEAIQNARNAFFSAVKTAVVAKCTCSLTGYFRKTEPGFRGIRDASYTAFYKMRKIYVLHHVPENGQPPRSFCQRPTRATEEGSFHTRRTMST
jgi:hypothetical protein